MATAFRQTRLFPALCTAALAAAAGVLLLAPGIASAETGITKWSASISTAQAGGHPDSQFHDRMENPRRRRTVAVPL